MSDKPENNESPPRHARGRIAGWGRQFAPGREEFSAELREASEGAVLFRGLGRSYGDSAIPPASEPVVVATPLADRILSFDRETGILRAEAGLSLKALNELYLRRGWFTPVSPGTQFVTLGGMVAGDVHGKNHHVAGCFGQHVLALTMRLADGRIVSCSRDENADLFLATIGGMGLTGHILEVTFTMKRIASPWILQETEKIDNLDAFMAGLQASAEEWPYTVGWIDCLARGKNMGRGILMRGRWAKPDEAPSHPPPRKKRIGIPFVFPEFVLNPLTVRAFNTLYYGKHVFRSTRGIVHPDTFFYPLDAIIDWNRIYGPRGFTQYQCVLPEKERPGSAKRFLELLTRLGGSSFLSVIKDCGAEGDGLLSFPMPGISIALDIAVRDNTRELVDRLNELVIDEGGRVYLCKDAFMRAEHFIAMESRLDEWKEVREKWNPGARIRSAQSVRLMGDKP
ncbi:MAG: FAD-binding oxidoreductase [Gemmatimonadetes bacterium]|nr:FAD-binding oxidoreductase [Gemmatimonadota bacterium]